MTAPIDFLQSAARKSSCSGDSGSNSRPGLSFFGLGGGQGDWFDANHTRILLPHWAEGQQNS
jgi:hypothetical protein